MTADIISAVIINQSSTEPTRTSVIFLFVFDDCRQMSGRSTVGHEDQHNSQPNTITETITETKMLLFLFMQPKVTPVTMATSRY